MRLIDADALHYWNPGHLTTGLWLSIADIQNAPTVPSITLKDHIECMGRATIKCVEAEKRLEQYMKENTVIKCKDCKYYEIQQLKKDGTDDRRYKHSYCVNLAFHPNPDWFCADGERREKC